jgi:hypothetical protein
MENIFTNTPDTSMFIPIFLFWSIASVVFIALISGLGCLFYCAIWLPWMTASPTDAQIAAKYGQLKTQLKETSASIRRRNLTDQRATIPLDLAQNYLLQARRLALQGKSKKLQMEALQKGLDQLDDTNHWLGWLTGFQVPAKRPAFAGSSAPDARTLAGWQSQPRRFAVKTRMFRRPFVYLDNSLPDTPPEKLLTFAEANGVAIMWEIDNEGDMAEAIVVDIHSSEVFPLFAEAKI